ncbi:hypothetical protein [Algoriphagus sp. NG3]|uniref:hypothetical protein n=1 Tax=Algoriphagus sp. NG3 TaxID=3097546 RepID=UPI002A818FFF|nr:hypothetical protein [Algoriphagus sp. NG3]WPR77332.1 hypothetical protein SLW71_08235 [Algoriphagus sp. NG3]
MNSYEVKSTQKTIQSPVSGKPTRQGDSRSVFQFVDKRHETIASRKLQEVANSSPWANQGRAFQLLSNTTDLKSNSFQKERSIISPKATVQCKFIRGKGDHYQSWKDLGSGRIYKQIEVQIDNKIKLSGNGETFYIFYFDHQWNREGVAPDPHVRPDNMPALLPSPPTSDETYSQHEDESVKPFLKGGRKLMGQRGAESQISGRTPPESHVREDAQAHEDIDGGAGLHELMPTNMRGKVASSGDETMIGIQSGARSSTALTAFNRTAGVNDVNPIGTPEAGLHTGFASRPSKRKGQAAAHDRMREVFDDILNASTTEEAVNIVMLRHYETIVKGDDILNSNYLTGMTPHLKGIGKIEPVSKTPGPNRLKLARLMHEIRESLKTRGRSLKRSETSGRSRSPSPPRRGYSPSGSGGDYEKSLRKEEYPTVPVPKFGGVPGSLEHTSNMSAWLTAPHRLGHDKEKEKAETSGGSFLRPIAYVADIHELASRSWNMGDRVEIETLPDGAHNVRVRFRRDFHGGSSITKSDLWLEYRGG